MQMSGEGVRTELLQAIEAGDEESIQAIIFNASEDDIEGATLNMGSRTASKLLQQVGHILRNDPGKTSIATIWIKNIVRGNSTLLSVASPMKDELQKITSVLKARSEMLGTVMKMKGKLEALVETRKAQRETNRESIRLEATKPLLVMEGGEIMAPHEDMDDELGDEEAELSEGPAIDDELDEEDEERLYQEAYENEELGLEGEEEFSD